jgi:hypothetical protein
MEHLGVFGAQSIKKVVKWYVIRLPVLFCFSHTSTFFSSYTVWFLILLPTLNLFNTPALLGCDQENEEKILFLGRVHKPP